MKKKILTGLVLLVFCSIGVFGGFPAGAAGEAAIGNTYYVSTMGADDNDGRSPSAPWKTLAKVSSQVFQPGDQILLRGGDEWVGEQLNLQGSGTAQNPILLSAYGTGRPKISNADPTLVLTNRSGWTIRGLELHNTCETPMTGGGNIIPTVSVQFTNSGVYHSLTIEDNLIYGDSHDRNTRGITLMAIYPGREEEVAFDIQISDNELHDVGGDAIMAYGWDTITDSNSVTSALYRNVDILRNQIYRTGNSGIILGTANHAAVKWNELHDIGIYEGEGNSLGSAGIISIVTSHVDILFNEVSRVSDSSSGNDGEGIDVDWQTEFNRVLYNHCYDNMGPGIGTMSNTHTTIQKNRVSGSRGLTAVGQGQITMTDFRVPSASLRGVNFLDLSDNLILIDEPGTQGIATSLGSGDPWTNNYVASNRFVLSPAVENISVFQFGAASQISSSNQNLVFSSNGSTFAASSNGQSYDSLASWQAGTGWDADTVLAPLDTQAPQSVTGLTATVRPSGRGVELTWDANGGQVDHYNLFRSTEANFEPGYTNMIGQTSQTEFTDAQELRGLTTYYYKVHAEDQIGNSGGNSQEVSVSIGALEPEDPLRYCASEDFSVIRQGPTWRYQSGTQGEYADIPQFDLSWNAWHIGGSEAFVAAYSQMPGADRDSVRTFSVPLDGTLELDPAGIQLAGPAEGSDGVLVRILHNGEPIWPSAGWQDVTWDTPAQSPQLTLQVKRGEELQFVVNRNETTAGDIVIWDPVLHLTEIVLPPDRPVMPPPYDYGLPQPLTRGLFAQDFDGGSAEGFTALSGTWQVEPDPDGGYRYRQSGTSPALAVAGETDWSEYTVSGDIEPIQLGPDGAVGICAMVQAADRCYRVQLNADNTIGIYKTFDGTESLLGSAPYPVTEGQRYELRVTVCRDADTGGQKIEVMVDGQAILSAVDSTRILAQGEFGLYSRGAAASFDAVSVDTYANAWVEAKDVLVYDTFDRGLTTGWTLIGGAWSESDQKLAQTGTAQAAAVAGNSWAQQCIAQVEITFPDGTGERTAGLLLRYADADHYLLASLSTAGEVILLQNEDGTESVLARAEYPIQAGVPYTVKVLADAGKTEVYINGERQISAGEPQASEGLFGLMTQNGGAYFDNVIVQALPPDGTAVFTQNFEDGDMSGWSALDGTWGIVEGTTNQVKQSGHGAGLLSAGGGFDNFELRYRMTVEDTGPEDAFANVCFKYTDLNNMYYVHFNTLYGIALKKAVGGVYSELDVKPAYPVVIGREYRVRITVDGRDIAVWVNGEKVLSAKDDSVGPGGLALWTINADVLYDDICVVN